MQKSVGHLRFIGPFEYYRRGEHVIRAPLGNAFTIEGWRHGRWECSYTHWLHAQEIYDELAQNVEKWKREGLIQC